jgi:photosystem II stability/assembly factor-like uncharacterized protein
LTTLVASGARANGRYPTAKHIVFDPADASHFVTTTTFGLLETRDRGRTFLWRCESALGVSGDQDELVAITGGGTTAAALTNGLVTTADGCSFRAAPELAGKYIADLALSRSAPHELYAFHTDIALSGELDSHVVRSIDDGQTWGNLGSPLPVTTLPLTIDVAPSDPMRVYISGRLGSADQYASVLLRSDDGGKTFQTLPIPGTVDQRLAYIAAVHPHDPNRLFFRVEDSPGTVIWSTQDGGQHFEKRFAGMGPLLGFAMSPDGSEIAFGGPSDGIWVGAENAVTFERRSDVGPSCLAWNAEGIYACSDQVMYPFSIGLSRDRAATFETLLRFESLCGSTACAGNTQASMLCAPAWETVAVTLGATCRIDAGAPVPDASAPEDAPSGGRDVVAGKDAEIDAAPPPPPPEPPRGCHCTLARSAEAAPGETGWIFAVLALGMRRRWKRRQWRCTSPCSSQK